MSIALYTGKTSFLRKVGPMAIIGRWQWSQVALGIEFVPWGAIFAIGFFTFCVTHLERNLAALERERS